MNLISFVNNRDNIAEVSILTLLYHNYMETQKNYDYTR